jgi:hypothetical protein
VEETRFWWGEAPVRPFDFNEAADLSIHSVWLHQFARRLVRRSLRLPISAVIIRRRSRSRGIQRGMVKGTMRAKQGVIYRKSRC